MPFAVPGNIQSVLIQEMMHVGGGRASLGNGYIVMTYNIISRKWSQLPEYTARWFAMTVIHDKLTLVGGYDHKYKVTNILGVWDADRRKWTRPYTPMPTPRCESSSIVYRQWLIVAGGWSDGNRTIVEVLDISSNQWYRAPSIPVPWSCMKSADVGDTWYLMGGLNDGERTDQVYSVSLSVLISHINNTSEKIWKTISSLGLYYCNPVCMGESLLAVGGSESQSYATVSTVLRFIPDRNEWREVGQLPSPLYECTCTPIFNTRLFLAGGFGHANKVHIAYF